MKSSVVFISGLILGVLSLFVPHPASLILWTIASFLVFQSMGGVKTIFVYIILLAIVSSKLVILNLPMFGSIESFGHLTGKIGSYELLDEDTVYDGISYVSVNGKGAEVILTSDIEGVIVSKSMRLRRCGKSLEIYSNLGGHVKISALEHLELNGVSVRLKGEGKIKHLEINGVGSEVDAIVHGLEYIEVNGVSNGLAVMLDTLPRIEVNGVGNSLKLDLTSVKDGELNIDIPGPGNDVTVYLSQDSKVFVREEETTPFLNNVRIIRRPKK